MALVFTIVRVLLGLFFALTGAVKLTDRISEDVYKQLRSQFVQFAEVFPLHDLGVQPDPLLYLQVTGWVELLAGLLLAFGPGLLQTLSSLVLSVVMIGALFTLIKLGEPLSMCAPATVCLGLLLLLILRGSGPRGRRVKTD